MEVNVDRAGEAFVNLGKVLSELGFLKRDRIFSSAVSSHDGLRDRKGHLHCLSRVGGNQFAHIAADLFD